MDIRKYRRSLEYDERMRFDEYYAGLSDDEKEWLEKYEGRSYCIGTDNFIKICPVCGGYTLDNGMRCPTCGWRYDDMEPEYMDPEEYERFAEYKENYERDKTNGKAEQSESVSVPERKVLLGGSKTFTALPEEAMNSLDYWMKRRAAFLIGDCEGADRLMQKYLHEKGYDKVKIYVNDKMARCNEGRWGVVHVLSPAWPYSHEYCSARDIQMAEVADEAYFLWDGNSLRTRENIIRMRQLGKEVTVCREQDGWCWEEECTDTHSSLSDECLQNELRRYSWEENTVINAAILRLARDAEKELHLKKDEVFMLERLLPDGKPDPDSPLYRPFLSFTDALAAIRDEMVTSDPASPKRRYVLEKWAAKGDFNLTFFRFRDELIEVDPPQNDYHMEETARFELEGDEVVNYRLINAAFRNNG